MKNFFERIVSIYKGVYEHQQQVLFYSEAFFQSSVQKRITTQNDFWPPPAQKLNAILWELPWRSYFTFVTFKNRFCPLNSHYWQVLLLSFFSFTFKPKILQSFISSQFHFFFNDIVSSQFPRDQYAPIYFIAAFCLRALLTK